MTKLLIIAFITCLPVSTFAQWQMQDSGSKASLRGIHAVNETVAWASGSSGTILRTTDGGAHWKSCAPPVGGEFLDFRGIWAWSSSEAMVMSSGPGEQSRVFETEDGCSHWTEMLRNKDAAGFWDAMVFQAGDFGFAIGDARTGVLIGDPVQEHFYTSVMLLGYGWFVDTSSCTAATGEAAFAASNSAVFVFGSRRYIFVTGGKGGSRALISPLLAYQDQMKPCFSSPLPLASGTDSSGAFAVSFRDLKHGCVVGGDYKQPQQSSGTAACTSDGGRHWQASKTPPRGYRSGVAWDAPKRRWVAVGTNGSDVSVDSGRTWSHLDDENWNAVSLPFAVGPNGRIGKLH